MERRTIICLFLFVVLVFSSCHARQVSDIKFAMTKEEVITLWGRTNLVTYKTVNGSTLETWEYHFARSGAICRITFVEDRVAGTPQCARPPVEGGYYSRSGQTQQGSRSTQRSFVREGWFAMKLAEALKIGPVKSEAEAGRMLASVGIAPQNGWIADSPVTPDIIEELQNAIAAAADSGTIAMNRAEAIKMFEDLIIEIESQYARVEPPPIRKPYFWPYYYPYPYYYGYLDPYPYYYPYPYFFGGYYRYHRHHHDYHRYHGHPHQRR